MGEFYVTVKLDGEFIDQIAVEAEDMEEAVELAKEIVKGKLTVSVDVTVQYDGQTLDVEPEIDEDELIDSVVEEKLEFEVEEA